MVNSKPCPNLFRGTHESHIRICDSRATRSWNISRVFRNSDLVKTVTLFAKPRKHCKVLSVKAKSP